MYRLDFAPGWNIHLIELDSEMQHRIGKKILQIQFLEKARHMKFGLPYFVVEVGQYRICFEQESSIRTIVFVGNHKQYEKWYAEQ